MRGHLFGVQTLINLKESIPNVYTNYNSYHCMFVCLLKKRGRERESISEEVFQRKYFRGSIPNVICVVIVVGYGKTFSFSKNLHYGNIPQNFNNNEILDLEHTVYKESV